MKLIDFLARLYHAITSKMKRKNYIIFESLPTMSDNTYWFFKYLIENTDTADRYKLVWVCKSKEEFKNELLGRKITCIIKQPDTLKEKLRFSYYQNFAKFIFDSNDYIRKKHRDQVRVFFGHGMPFKIVRSYEKQKGEVDVDLITSYSFTEHFTSLGESEDSVKNFGYCRNDILAKNAGKRDNGGEYAIIWMPTYRQHKSVSGYAVENSFPLGLPAVKSHDDLMKVNEQLFRNNAVLYLRPHPSQDVSVLRLETLSNIAVADDAFLNKKGVTLYEFLTQTDALISDYSSIYYDYLLLDRPIALMTEDVEEFTAKWPLYYDSIYDAQRYNRILTVDELCEFIKDVADGNDKRQEARRADAERFHDHRDGNACRRTYEYLKSEYGL